MTFLIFTFGGQRRLVELLSYGEYNQLFISVVFFVEAAQLSVLFLIINSFFLISKKIPHT